MGTLKLTKEGINKFATIRKEGIYPVFIVSVVGPRASKNKQSDALVWDIQGKIQDPGGENDGIGVPIWLNDKMMEDAASFHAACHDMTVGEMMGSDNEIEVNLQECEGKTLLVDLRIRLNDNGAKQTDTAEFIPLKLKKD